MLLAVLASVICKQKHLRIDSATTLYMYIILNLYTQSGDQVSCIPLSTLLTSTQVFMNPPDTVTLSPLHLPAFPVVPPLISSFPLPYLRQLILPDISSVARIRRWLDIMMHCLRLQTTKLRDFSLDMGLVMTPLSAANTGKDHLTHCAHNLYHICCSCELY